jgi:hypothetical protein
MMETLIRAAVDKGAATLHIKAGDVFRARIKDDLVKLSDEPLADEDVLGLALTLLPDQALKDRVGDITDYDFAWEMADVARFRKCPGSPSCTCHPSSPMSPNSPMGSCSYRALPVRGRAPLRRR